MGRCVSVKELQDWSIFEKSHLGSHLLGVSRWFLSVTFRVSRMFDVYTASSLTGISHCRQLTQKRRTEYSGIPWILRGHPWNILPRGFPEACNTGVMCMTKLLCQLFDWANLRGQESKGCLKKETRWWHSLDTRPRCLHALRKEWSISQFLHFYWSKLWWDKRNGVLRTVLKISDSFLPSILCDSVSISIVIK